MINLPQILSKAYNLIHFCTLKGPFPQYWDIFLQSTIPFELNKSIYDSNILKWKAGVIIRLRLFHFSPEKQYIDYGNNNIVYIYYNNTKQYIRKNNTLPFDHTCWCQEAPTYPGIQELVDWTLIQLYIGAQYCLKEHTRAWSNRFAFERTNSSLPQYRDSRTILWKPCFRHRPWRTSHTDEIRTEIWRKKLNQKKIMFQSEENWFTFISFKITQTFRE